LIGLTTTNRTEREHWTATIWLQIARGGARQPRHARWPKDYLAGQSVASRSYVLPLAKALAW
jgi:hypothetical protein